MPWDPSRPELTSDPCPEGDLQGPIYIARCPVLDGVRTTFVAAIR